MDLNKNLKIFTKLNFHFRAQKYNWSVQLENRRQNSLKFTPSNLYILIYIFDSVIFHSLCLCVCINSFAVVTHHKLFFYTLSNTYIL